MKNFNGGAGRGRRRTRGNAYIYNVYARGNIGTARTEKEKVKSRYEKIILSEKPFLLNKTACKVCCACAIIGVAEQESGTEAAQVLTRRRGRSVYFEK